LKKLEVLGLYNNLTDVGALARLTQLKYLFLQDNPNLTKVEIDKLQEVLPERKIFSAATK